MNSSNKTSNRAAFFDLDLTITSRDTFRYFLQEYYVSNWRRWQYLPWVFSFGVLRKLRLIELQTFKEKALIAMLGHNENKIKNKGERFFKNKLGAVIRGNAIEEVEKHKKENTLVYLVSASPDIYVHKIAEYLDCDGYHCSKLAYNEGGFIGKFHGRDFLGNEKAKYVKELAELDNINLEESYCYTDHESDLPLMEIVGNPFAVNPTEKLKEIAIQKGWKIVDWNRL